MIYMTKCNCGFRYYVELTVDGRYVEAFYDAKSGECRRIDKCPWCETSCSAIQPKKYHKNSHEKS